MLIPHIIGVSGVHGTGLFTVLPLDEGTELWNFDPSIDDRCRLGSLDPLQRIRALHYGYINPSLPEWLVICGDHARYWNFPNPGHAANARLGMRMHCGENVIVACRHIPAGEELLIEPASDADYFRKMRHVIRHALSHGDDLMAGSRPVRSDTASTSASAEGTSFPFHSRG